MFLVWLWISNLALLLGAELARGRTTVAERVDEDDRPFLPLRDTWSVLDSDTTGTAARPERL